MSGVKSTSDPPDSSDGHDWGIYVYLTVSQYDDASMNRRTFLTLTGIAGTAGLAGCSGSDPPTEPEYGDWFENTDNFDGFGDRTDENRVTVLVGAGPQGWQFEPPAVTVTPGTTLVFEWTGEGGEHNVEHAEGDWQNPEGTVATEGHTWERAFDDAGTHRYNCWPHDELGMRGAVFVDASAE